MHHRFSIHKTSYGEYPYVIRDDKEGIIVHEARTYKEALDICARNEERPKHHYYHNDWDEVNDQFYRTQNFMQTYKNDYYTAPKKMYANDLLKWLND